MTETLKNNPMVKSINEKIPEIGTGIIEDLLVKLPKVLKNTIKNFQEVSYQEVMEYFSIHKYDTPHIAKGILLRETDGSGMVTLIQTFLDKDNAVVNNASGEPLGRKFRVERLDNELREVFKHHSAVVIE